MCYTRAEMSKLTLHRETDGCRIAQKPAPKSATKQKFKKIKSFSWLTEYTGHNASTSLHPLWMSHYCKYCTGEIIQHTTYRCHFLSDCLERTKSQSQCSQLSMHLRVSLAFQMLSEHDAWHVYLLELSFLRSPRLSLRPLLGWRERYRHNIITLVIVY